MRTLYRQFKQGRFDQTTFSMKGKRKSSGYHEKREKKAFEKNISEK